MSEIWGGVLQKVFKVFYPDKVEPIFPQHPPFVIPDESYPPQVPEKIHKKRFTWVIDPGHGALTLGKRSPKLPDGRQLLEYEFNGDVVDRIARKLKYLGVDYFITVPLDHQQKVGNFLEQRVIRANFHKSKYPKIFVSVHANAGAVKNAATDWSRLFRGIETFYFQGSEVGKAIANVFQDHLVNYSGLKDRGVKSTSTFYVLKNTDMPAILTENGFFNNPDEVLLLLSDEYRQKIADAHVAAILEIEKQGLPIKTI